MGDRNEDPHIEDEMDQPASDYQEDFDEADPIRLLVLNLPETATPQELNLHFSKYARVVGTDITT